MTVDYFDYDHDACVLGPCKESPMKVSVEITTQNSQVTGNFVRFLSTDKG